MDLESIRELLKEIEKTIGADWRAPRVLKLTRFEELFVSILVKKGRAPRETVELLLWGNSSDDVTNPRKSIDNLVSKVRAKLNPCGIDFETLHGQGFHMSPANRKELKAWSKREYEE